MRNTKKDGNNVLVRRVVVQVVMTIMEALNVELAMELEKNALNLGDIITFKGKSRKGKNRIHEHGDKWSVHLIRDDSVMVDSVATGYFRNVDFKNDKDFEPIS